MCVDQCKIAINGPADNELYGMVNEAMGLTPGKCKSYAGYTKLQFA